MKLKQLSKRERLILYITLFVIAFLLGFKFIISPIIDKLENIDKEIERKVSLLKRYSRLINRGENIFSLYDNYEDMLEEEGSPEEIVSYFFDEIKEAAIDFGVSIKKVKPSPAKEKKQYKEVLLEVELEGDFKSLFEFISNLEYSPRLIRISSLRLLPQPQPSRQLRCQLTLSKLFF